MLNKTQIERVEGRLKQCGQITRNECLRNYISRLGAIIFILKEKGYEFETSHKGGDYVYKVTKFPGN